MLFQRRNRIWDDAALHPLGNETGMTIAVLIPFPAQNAKVSGIYLENIYSFCHTYNYFKTT